MTPQQLTALKTELTADTRGYGYAAKIKAMPSFPGGTAPAEDWNGLAELVNLARTGINTGPAITIRRTDIAIADIYAAIDVADYTAIAANPNATQLSTERRFLSWLAGLSALTTIRLLDDAGADTPVVKNFKAMFAGATPTMTRLSALASRFGSRAEELFGRGVVVTDGDVETAARL